MADNLLTTTNPVFQTYLFYCCVLCIKMLAMSILTARQRFRKRVFLNPEDISGIPKASVNYDDPDVERVRRAHQNDLENIPVFMVVALAYVMTNPSPSIANNLFRIYTFGRIFHTLVYAVIVVPQPARFLGFLVGFLVTLYMAFAGLCSFIF